MGSNLKVHFKSDGEVSSINGNYLPNIAINTRPKLGKGRAISIAKNQLSTMVGVHQNATDPIVLKNEQPELYVYNEGFLSSEKTTEYSNHLVWKFSLYSEDAPVNQLFFIDAQTGSLIHTITQVIASESRETYTLADCLDYTGTLTYTEVGLVGSHDVQAEAVDTYAGEIYDYYYSNFSRDSFDGAGGLIKSYTHYEEWDDSTYIPGCVEVENAYWTGNHMLFGEDYISLDVFGHELTHAVVQYTAELGTEDDPGALNESYADIFGELVEFENGGGDWLHGTDLPAGPNRDFEDPNMSAYDKTLSYDATSNYGQPAHLLEKAEVTDPICDSLEDDDNGCIHFNSGITNNALYLLIEGGTNSYSGETVTGGVPREAAEQIYYRALTTYLDIASDFSDDYYATMQSCLDLNESDSSTYPITYCEEVFDAFAAVGINTDSSYAWANISASATTGTAPVAIIFDGADSVAINSTISSYAWDFGDGSTDSGGAVNHTFSNAGTYTVTLTVIDSTGYTSDVSTTITVYASGSIGSDTTWSAAYSPYVLSGSVSISSGYTLTIEPGVVIKFYDSTSYLTVNGTLDAQGTATDGIVFTSYQDDDYGGDTNGDSTATTPAAGDWESLAFAAGSTATFDYTTIQYGGYDSGSGGIWDGGMLFVDQNATSISVNHSTLQESQFPTIRTDSGSTLNISNSAIRNTIDYQDAIYVVDGSVTLSDNSIEASTSSGYGMYVDAGTLVVTGNTVEAYYGVLTNTATSLTISNNTFSNAYYSVLNQSSTLEFQDNSITNCTRAITTTASASIIGNTISSCDYGIVDSGISSTISDNTISDADYGIYIYDSPTVSRNTVSGGFYGIFINNSGTPTITSNTITGAMYGIFNMPLSSSPVINRNLIYDNISYGLTGGSSTSIIDAENNWWGDASGPYNATSNPSGLGDTVSDYVDFDPWLTDIVAPSDVTIGTIRKDAWAQTITLNWTNPTDSDFDHVQIDRTDVTAGTTTTLASSETGTSYIDTTPSYNTTYTYTLYTVDTTGNVSTGVTTTNQRLRNPAPTNLVLTAGDTTIAATWNTSSAPASTIGGYIVYYGTSRTALTNSVDVGNVTSTTLTGLTNYTRYFVAVTAYSTGGHESAQSGIRATRLHP